MLKQIKRWACLAALLAASAGCEMASDAGGGKNVSMDDIALQIEGKPKAAPAAAAPAGVVPENSNFAVRKSGESAASAPPSSTEAPAAEGAVPPDAKKASDTGPQRTNPNTYMGAVIGANKSIRERVSDLSWQKSVQLYEASNGHKPRNTQEFVDHMRGEGTPLPELERDEAYLYVPEEGQFGELYKVRAGQTPNEQTPSGKAPSTR